MKNTPEVTTALALTAERLSTDERFKNSPCEHRRVFLSIFAKCLFTYFDLKGDQREEFAGRYIYEIIAPWCSKEYQNDAS